jgi:hypothetical protein
MPRGSSPGSLVVGDGMVARIGEDEGRETILPYPNTQRRLFQNDEVLVIVVLWYREIGWPARRKKVGS